MSGVFFQRYERPGSRQAALLALAFGLEVKLCRVSEDWTRYLVNVLARVAALVFHALAFIGAVLMLLGRRLRRRHSTRP